MDARHTHPLDLFSPKNGLIDPSTGRFPTSPAIHRVGHDYRALLEDVAKRAFTPATVEAVNALADRSTSASQALAEAVLDGATEILGRDGNVIRLKLRTGKQRDRDLAVEAAFDALKASVRRLEQEYPGLGARLRSLLDADDRAAYEDLRGFASTEVARATAAQILRTLGSTERRRARLGVAR